MSRAIEKERTMSKKKATVGERIALRENSDCLGLDDLRSGKYAAQELARRIDAAIKRAVREAVRWAWYEAKDKHGKKIAREKYGVTL